MTLSQVGVKSRRKYREGTKEATWKEISWKNELEVNNEKQSKQQREYGKNKGMKAYLRGEAMFQEAGWCYVEREWSFCLSEDCWE